MQIAGQDEATHRAARERAIGAARDLEVSARSVFETGCRAYNSDLTRVPPPDDRFGLAERE